MPGKDIQSISRRLWAKLEKDLAGSPFAASLRGLATAQTRFQAGRPLSYGERLCLESQGNICADWSRVRLENDAGMETIRNNWFEGEILISGFRGEWPGPGGRTWPAGMANCRVRDCIIGNACLYHIARMERQVIEDGAVLVGLGEMDCPGPTLFSLGQAIHPGTEGATRTVWLWDALTMDDCVDSVSLNRAAQKDIQARLERILAPFRCKFGYVGRGAAVLHARHIHSAWIGPGSVITGASLIREAALLSTLEEPCVAGEEAWIEHGMLQPGARVESSGKVSQSILLEHSEISWGGMVFQSVIGPNTHITKGEISTSLIGPFVGFHHQSLLISALWPEGRGNIAYGANVGSNHTGKKPDQEIRPGEGNFFGLGCSIKYPANFEDSPYSIIATGVVLLPQRLSFPFSLINQPHLVFPELGPAINEIGVGWMWSDNAYALVRRSYRLLDGNKARRHDFTVDHATTLNPGFFTGRMFAPVMVRRVLKAIGALKAAPKGKAYYVEQDIPGLGKNFLPGKKLAAAVAAYEDYLVFYLLRTYADRGPEAGRPENRGPENSGPDAKGAETKELVVATVAALGIEGDVKAYLAGQLHRLHGFKDTLLHSVARDDKRGRQVFDDYADFHDAPEDDSTIARIEKEVKALLGRLETVLKGKPPLDAKGVNVKNVDQSEPLKAIKDGRK